MSLKISNSLKKLKNENVKLEKNVSFKMPTAKQVRKKRSSLDTTQEYVNNHTSGIRYSYKLCDSGMEIVSLHKFKEMIADGYNIIRSEVLAPDYISIEYQKEIKKGISR